MGIRAFLEPVQASITTIMEAASVAVPEFDVGWKSTLRQYGPVPRVVWVPRGGPTVGDAVDGNDVSTPRKLASRKVIVDAHIWGKDIDHCEDLANYLIGGLQAAVWGSFRVAHEDWEAGSEAEDTADGQLLVLSVEIRLPWTRPKTRAVAAPISLDVTASDPPQGT